MMNKILLYILLPLFFTACSDEQSDLGSEHLLDVPEGKSLINIDITTGNFHKPGTKTINPDAEFSNPYILSFKLQNNGSATDTILQEVVKTTLNGDKYNALLAKSTEPHLLVFIANADSLVRHRVLSHAIITKRYGEVMPLFTYGEPSISGSLGLYGLKNPTSFIPFVNERIPMWAKLNIDKIETTKISIPVYLQRIVSKIYIDASEANKKNNFTLNGFTVLGVPSYAYFDNDGAVNKDAPQLKVNYGYSSSGNATIDKLIIQNISGNTTQSVTNDKPVYVFPFRKDDEGGGVYNILFSGHFGDNVIKYFKVKIGGPDSPANLNQPNIAYRINIESIANNGYVSLAQALQSEPGTGVVVSVILLDQSHEIVANGQYYMGLSQSEFQLYADGEQKNVTVATINTNAFSLGTTVPMSRIELLSGTNMTLVAGQTISSNSTDIKVDFNDEKTATGTIRVTIGDLTRDIIVKKDWAITGNFKNLDPGILIASDVISAHVVGNNPRVALDNTRFTFIKKQNFSSLEGTSAYLFIKNTIDEDVLEVRALTATGNTILVRNVTNIPEFAGNNIYWDDLNNTPKFDDYITAAKERTLNIQGVPFLKWGLLISLQGSTLTPLKGHVKTVNNDPSYDNITWIAYDKPGADDRYSNTEAIESFLTHGRIKLDPDNNIGDICEFMTRRGLTPTNRFGKKWKLPSPTDVQKLPRRIKMHGERPTRSVVPASYLTNRSGLSPVEVYSNTADLFYFPLSVTMRTEGDYWTSSIVSFLSNTERERSGIWYASYGNVLNPSLKPPYYYTQFDFPANAPPAYVRCVRDNAPGEIVPLYKIEYDLNEADGGRVTIPAGRKLLNQFVDKGRSATLSTVVLQSSNGKVHSGWLINKTYYALGSTLPNIQSDLIVKAVW